MGPERKRIQAGLHLWDTPHGRMEGWTSINVDLEGWQSLAAGSPILQSFAKPGERPVPRRVLAMEALFGRDKIHIDRCSFIGVRGCKGPHHEKSEIRNQNTEPQTLNSELRTTNTKTRDRSAPAQGLPLKF